MIVIALLGAVTFARSQAVSTWGLGGPTNSACNCGGDVPSGGTCVFCDDFNGSSLDTSKWTINTYGSALVAPECDTIGNVSVSGGLLFIGASADAGPYSCPNPLDGGTLVQPYSGSAISQTTFHATYGRIKYRAKMVDRYVGAHTTSWLLGAQCQSGSWVPAGFGPPYWSPGLSQPSGSLGGQTLCGWPQPIAGEVDINEEVPEASTGSGLYEEVQQTYAYIQPIFDDHSAFHVFELNWTPTGFRFYIDSIEQNPTGYATTSFSFPMFLLLSMDVGFPRSFPPVGLPFASEYDYVYWVQCPGGSCPP